MAEYLEQLGPEGTVGQVFTDLYHYVDATIGRLEQIKDRDVDNRSPNYIPGTLLAVRHSAVPDELLGKDVAAKVVATVGVDIRYPVIERGGNIPPLSSPATRPIPIRVAAYRADELSPDFSLFQNPINDTVAIRLVQRGLRWSRRQLDHPEPVGRGQERIDQAIGQMDPTSYERLSIVTCRILDAVTAIEMIMGGGDTTDVIEALHQQGMTTS